MVNENTSNTVVAILYCIYAVLLLAIGLYVSNKMTLKQKRCGILGTVYATLDGELSSIEPSQLNKTSATTGCGDGAGNGKGMFECALLRDYYIKTAHNCCAVGAYKNSFVSLCALDACMSQGFRCLDFEIYSIDDKPVVAVSSLGTDLHQLEPVTNYFIKESYNSIPFDRVVQRLKQNAFSSTACPNPEDPLFLHLRIKSSSIKVCNAMGAIIRKKLEPAGYLLPSSASCGGGGCGGNALAKNLGQVPMVELMGKIVIIADLDTSTTFRDAQTTLFEFVNIVSGGDYMTVNRYTAIKNGDVLDNAEMNKKNMSIVLPDVSPRDDNYDPFVCFNSGIQFIGMNVQNYDANLEYYNAKFGDAGKAIMLKPKDQRINIIQTRTVQKISADNNTGTQVTTDYLVPGGAIVL